MHGLALATLAALLVTPALTGVSSPEPETVYERIVASIVAAFGFVPPTALVNGVEVPADQALALLRANDAPLPSDEQLYVPPDDVGVGARLEGGPCLVAAVLTATGFSLAGEPEPLVDEHVVPSVPPELQGELPCGPGFAYSPGLGGAVVGPDANFAVACVGLGGWLHHGGECRDARGASVNILGEVGFVRLRFGWGFGFLTIEQMFGGVKDGLHGATRQARAAVMSIDQG